MDADGGGDVGQVVLVAGGDDAIVPGFAAGIAAPGVVGEAVERHHADAIGEGWVVCDRHSAFARCDGLVGVEGKAGDGGGVFAAALPGAVGGWTPSGWEGVCRVFDDPEVVLLGEGMDGGHVHHEAGNVDGDDANDGNVFGNRGGEFSGAEVCELLLGVGEVHVEGVRIAVDEDGDGALVADDLGRGGKGHGGDEDGSVRAKLERLDGEMQSGGAGVECDGVFGADGGGEFGLEAACDGTGR